MKRILLILLIVAALVFGGCGFVNSSEQVGLQCSQADEDANLTEQSKIERPIDESPEPATEPFMQDPKGASAVTYTSYPGEYKYSFFGEDAIKFAEYLAEFTFVPHTTPTEEEVMGGGWALTLRYEDGSCETVFFKGDRRHIVYKDVEYITSTNEIELDRLAEEIINHNLKEGFVAYFAELGLNENLSQGDFVKLVESYSYNQAPVMDLAVYCNYDSEWGGGWDAQSEHFSFTNDYRVSEDEREANYSNSIFTTVALEGMALPFGISFDDTVEAVLKKCGVEAELNQFAVGEEVPLYLNDTTSIILADLKNTEDNVYSYSLNYTGDFYMGDTVVTKNVVLKFNKDLSLGSVSVAVNKRYKLVSG